MSSAKRTIFSANFMDSGWQKLVWGQQTDRHVLKINLIDPFLMALDSETKPQYLAICRESNSIVLNCLS